MRWNWWRVLWTLSGLWLASNSSRRSTLPMMSSTTTKRFVYFCFLFENFEFLSQFKVEVSKKKQSHCTDKLIFCDAVQAEVKVWFRDVWKMMFLSALCCSFITIAYDLANCGSNEGQLDDLDAIPGLCTVLRQTGLGEMHRRMNWLNEWGKTWIQKEAFESCLQNATELASDKAYHRRLVAEYLKYQNINFKWIIIALHISEIPNIF